MGPVERRVRARLGDGRGLTIAEARQLGTLAAVILANFRRRDLVLLREGGRYHLRERLASEELRDALAARAAREADEAARTGREAADLGRARERAAVLAELRSARSVEDARRIAAEHRAVRLSAGVAEKLATAPETLTGLEIEQLFQIELDPALHP